jgi:hypothetical protein
VGVQEVRWNKGGTEQVDEYTFFYDKGNDNHELGIGLFVHKRIISAVKRVEFVSDRMSYIILSRVLVTATGFGFVIVFINHSQVVTIINYNTVPDFHTTKHSTLIFSVYLHLSSLCVSQQRISTQELSQPHTSNITAPSLS